ncbi:MAG: four helix bundle protein [Candidatus Aenigmarchaeota archaeon]|nr:four helix bundle protein [Candidatus Aenigmarchaeota archaeon]
MAQNYNKLRVYQESMTLATDIYQSLKGMNRDFRIKEQLTASVTSIGANLAEMSAFDHPGQIRQKLVTCIAEANETEHWIEFCKTNGIIDPASCKDFTERIQKVRRMLYSLLKTV